MVLYQRPSVVSRRCFWWMAGLAAASLCRLVLEALNPQQRVCCRTIAVQDLKCLCPSSVVSKRAFKLTWESVKLSCCDVSAVDTAT